MNIDKLDEHTGRDKCGIYYMLRANKKNPSVGDSYTMLTAIWSDGDGRENAKKLKQSLAGSLNFSQAQTKNWGGWEILWQGGNYSLQDLGENDVDGLKFIFMDAIEKTYSQIKDELGHLS